MSRERMTGRILIVWEDTVGTVLASDAAAGATVLNVDDVAAFNGATNDDGPGGWLQVGDQVVQYTGIDDDASTITLAAGLPAAVTVGSETGDVLVWNDLYGEPDTVQWAEVKPSGKRNQADTIEAVVSDSIDGLANGDRGGPGESCTLVRDGDEWQLTGVRGRPARSKGVKFATDSFTVSTAGAQAFTLSHEPTEDSQHEHLRWHPAGGAGVDWNNAEWSRTGTALTIPDPDGIIEADDAFTVKYAYLVGVISPWTTLVDWQASGWKYLLTTVSADVNRSAVGYDDSGWSIGSAAFGNAANHPSTYPADQKSGWPDKSTTWPVTPQGSTNYSRLWLRRAVTCTPNKVVRVSARIDNSVTFWWNGIQVGSGQSNQFTPVQFDIDPANVQASNVLAVRGEDYGADNYLDVQVLTQGGAA